MQDVEAKLQTVSSLNKDAIFNVYTDAQFLELAKNHNFPAVGVWYEGLAPLPDSSGRGLSSTLGMSIFVLGQSTTYDSILEDKHDITQILDDIRGAIRHTQSPSGHPWRFVSEAPYPISEDIFVYIQRWASTTILTS